MKYKIVRSYDKRKTVTYRYSFESAYQEYQERESCNAIQVYLLMGETPILLAQKEY